MCGSSGSRACEKKKYADAARREKALVIAARNSAPSTEARHGLSTLLDTRGLGFCSKDHHVATNGELVALVCSLFEESVGLHRK